MLIEIVLSLSAFVLVLSGVEQVDDLLFFLPRVGLDLNFFVVELTRGGDGGGVGRFNHNDARISLAADDRALG